MATPALWIFSFLRFPPIPHTTSPLSLSRFGLLTNLLDTAFTSAGFAPTLTLPVLLMISPAQAIPYFGLLPTSLPINSLFVRLSSSFFTTTHSILAIPLYSLPSPC